MSDPDPSVAVVNYWINTVSRDHVQRGVAGGFTQANHGKPNLLRRMARGDWLVFYSLEFRSLDQCGACELWGVCDVIGVSP